MSPVWGNGTLNRLTSSVFWHRHVVFLTEPPADSSHHARHRAVVTCAERWRPRRWLRPRRRRGPSSRCNPAARSSCHNGTRSWRPTRTLRTGRLVPTGVCTVPVATSIQTPVGTRPQVHKATRTERQSVQTPVRTVGSAPAVAREEAGRHLFQFGLVVPMRPTDFDGLPPASRLPQRAGRPLHEERVRGVTLVWMEMKRRRETEPWQSTAMGNSSRS